MRVKASATTPLMAERPGADFQETTRLYRHVRGRGGAHLALPEDVIDEGEGLGVVLELEDAEACQRARQRVRQRGGDGERDVPVEGLGVSPRGSTPSSSPTLPHPLPQPGQQPRQRVG